MAKSSERALPQVAALPLRVKEGQVQVLLITSRDTRRWIVPKGWPIKGETSVRAAEIEALEEAGAVGDLHPDPIGHYSYRKVLSEDEDCLCRVAVFPMRVQRLEKTWKEQSERKRKWFMAKEAAKRVREPELAEILRTLSRQRRKHPALKALLAMA